MNMLKPSILSAVLVIFVAFLGISAGNADALTPAVMSPLLAAQYSNAYGESGEIAALSGGATSQVRVDFVEQPENASPVWKAISVGNGHSCAIRNDDTLQCWGDNSFGQAVPPGGQFLSVAAGMVQSCAIRIDGQLLCWGSEWARPKISPEGTFHAVSTGNTHTCAIRNDGKLLCWGTQTLRQTLAPEGRFEAISAGGNHTCGLQEDGRVICWGEQSFTDYPVPEGRFQAVATGESHACAIRQDDSLVCWGNNGYGQIKVPEGAFKTLAAGGFHTCGLRLDGVSVCWGRSDSGQSSAPAGEGFKVLSAGGASSCGIRPDDSLQCWGGNGVTEGLTGMRAQLLESAHPQVFPFAFLIQVVGFIGTGLVNTGKAVDRKWTGAEATGVKVQLALLAVSVVMSAVQQFLPKPPDPVAEALERLEADIQELKAAIGRIESQVKQIQAKLNTLACNTSLQPLVNAAVTIETAQTNYLQRMNQAQIVLQAYAARAQDPTVSVPDPNSDMAKFVGDYEKDLQMALNAIHESLVPGLSTKSSGLDDCMEKSIGQWKAQAEIPFVDDRTYYQPIYEIVGYALAYQGMALTMLQDIHLWHAQQKLSEGQVEYNPGDILGYCAIIRENVIAGGPKVAFWQQAQAYCDDNTKLTENTYKRMVQQVERAGAPYADDDTLLSAGPKLIGKSDSWWKDSWLWVRDVDAYGNTMGFFKEGIPQPQLNLDKDYTLYRNWEPAGQAWLDVRKVLVHQVAAKTAVDLPTLMRDRAGFKNITGRLLWASPKTFDVSWNNIADWHTYHPFGHWYDVDAVTTHGMKCFVGSGIGPKYSVDKGVFGLVCHEDDLKRIAGRVGWNWSKGKKHDLNLEIGTRSWEDNRYQQYRDLLGAAMGYWYCWNHFSRNAYISENTPVADGTITQCDWRGFKSKTAYFPDQDKELYRWPVVDVEQLQCTDSMVKKGHKRKKTTEGGALTRCGDDFDRFINALVPRPESFNNQAVEAASDAQSSQL